MSLQIQFDQDALRPLIRLAVAEALERMEVERAKFNGRLAFTEPEAAVLLGVKPHVLRDCRRRGELQGAKVGSKIVYTRADLLEFLERQKENS
ncbi:MAG TPA: helix-turn-helix domain-containing protein [Thermoguttaceae bacterium]|nr:helix-turn-helix domain-containing protein [Thermoguttaceae bacterium]